MQAWTRSFAVIVALTMLGSAGCLRQDAGSPVAPAAPAVEDADAVDRQMVEDALAHLHDMVVPANPVATIDQKSWAPIEAALDGRGIAVRAAAGRAPARLPLPLFSIVHAVRAMNAVNTRDWWNVYTSFRNTAGGDIAGFSLSWLVPLPDEPDGSYLWNLYLDRPATWPDSTVEVEPYAQPIEDAVRRQYIALSNPAERIYDRNYYEDDLVVWDYGYAYHSDIGDRVVQIYQVRLAIRPE